MQLLPIRPSPFAKKGCPKEDSARAQPFRERDGQAKRVHIWNLKLKAKNWKGGTNLNGY